MSKLPVIERRYLPEENACSDALKSLLKRKAAGGSHPDGRDAMKGSNNDRATSKHTRS